MISLKLRLPKYYRRLKVLNEGCSDSLLALSRNTYQEDGTRKPDHYFEVYENFLSSKRDLPINILELGVASGSSLLVWREFFSKACIVGLELMPPPIRLTQAIRDKHIHFVQADQSNPLQLARVMDVTKGEKYDVIIDDASHFGSLSKSSFDYLFDNALKDGGLYFVEDYGTSYMPNFYDGSDFKAPVFNKSDKTFPSVNSGMVGWLKQLIDEINVPAIYPEHQSRPIKSLQFWPHIMLIQKY